MDDRKLSALSEHELLAELAECISLEGEAKARGKPIRAELLRRQTATGEIVEHDGWVSNLKREPMSVALLERHWGYPKDELPASIFTEKTALVLDEEKVRDWLKEKGHDFGPTYALDVRRKQSKTKA